MATTSSHGKLGQVALGSTREDKTSGSCEITDQSYGTIKGNVVTGGENFVLKLLRCILGLLLIAVVLINVANASSRYLFSWSPTGADEAMVYLIIIVVMLGSVVALFQRQHISVNLLPGLLDERSQKGLHLLHDAVALFAFGMSAWWSWSFVHRISMVDIRSMALGIPMTWPHGVVFLGLFCFSLVCASKLLGFVLRQFVQRSRRVRVDGNGERP